MELFYGCVVSCRSIQLYNFTLLTSMKNTYYFFISFILIGLFGCDDSNTDTADSGTVVSSESADDGSVTRIWKLKEIDRSGFPEEDNPLKYSERKMHSKGYYINLFPDNTGTLIEHSECQSFEWSMDSIANKIVFKKKPRYASYKELEIVKEDGKMQLIAIFPDAGKIILEPYSEITRNPEEDPFHPKNNLWRFRKRDNENAKEIEAKADNYLQHVRYLFKARIDNPNRRFSTVNSSGVLNIYDGGIGVTEKSKISEDWYSYFYTKEQAVAAWKMVRKRIGRNTLRSNRDGDWIEENYKVLVKRLDGE